MKETRDDDAALMVRIATRDKQAFAALMNRHLAAVLRFNTQYLPQEAEDITQEAFIRLWNKAPTWKDQGVSAKAWLLRVSYNLCIDELRKYKAETLDEQTMDRVNPSLSEEDRLGVHDDFRWRMNALQALPERQRTAIALCACSGLNNREAAAILNISVDALESLLARGRRALKQQFVDTDDQRGCAP